MEMRDLAEINAELQEKKERQDNVNFKMVTFSLSGKDYGVDIMNIKEIAKADKFTYVPNASGFVRGVYNLRGDIIPIIDLRLFFHLPIEKKEDPLENMLILHIDDRVYGTIVDKIDRVIGINTQVIQPPHPIFGDINIKYISGVVEQRGDLYIILDVIRIFTQREESDEAAGVLGGGESAYYEPELPAGDSIEARKNGYSDNDLAFIKDGLAALKRFYASAINEKWIAARLGEWSRERSSSNIQLKNTADAEEFLNGFYSPHSGRFWTDDYAYHLKGLLPELSSSNIQVWNPGCGKGYETFSLACILKLRYPEGRIKIWANDNDIMAIANAPNMVFNIGDVPEYCRTFLVKGRNGYVFSGAIKDAIVFEYHDVTNPNTLPDLDVVVARDLLSFLNVKGQDLVLAEIEEKLRTKGVVVLGANERMPASSWKAVGKDSLSAFVRI
jgi:purine-binding chemotaxis protein CheW